MAKTNLEAFDKFLKALNAEVLTPEQFKTAFTKVWDIVQKEQARNIETARELKSLIEKAKAELEAQNENKASESKQLVANELKSALKRLQERENDILKRLAEVRDGEDADEEYVIEEATQAATRNAEEFVKEAETRLFEELNKLGEQIAELFDRLDESSQRIDGVNRAVGAIRIPSPVNWTRHQTLSLSSGTTVYSLDDAPGHGGKAALVRYEGQVLTETTHYSISGTDITLTFDPDDSTALDVTYWCG